MVNFKHDDNNKYLLFDFESEGLSLSQKNRAWQLSYLVCQGGKILEKHDKFLWWSDLNVGEEAARVTRFNYDSYKSKSEDPRKVLEDFDKLLYNSHYYILGHNILGFDIYLHNIMKKQLGYKTDYSYIDRCIDTKSLSMMYRLGLKTVDTENLYQEMLKFNNYIQKGIKTSLGVMCKEFDIFYDQTQSHSGDYDCEVNFQLWNKLKFCFDWK